MIPNSPIIVNMSIPIKEQEIIYCHAERIEEDDEPLYVQQMQSLFNLAQQ